MSAADFARTFQSKVRQGDKCVLLSRVCFKYQVSAGDHSVIPAWAAMKRSCQPLPSAVHNYQYEPKLSVL